MAAENQQTPEGSAPLARIESLENSLSSIQETLRTLVGDNNEASGSSVSGMFSAPEHQGGQAAVPPAPSFLRVQNHIPPTSMAGSTNHPMPGFLAPHTSPPTWLENLFGPQADAWKNAPPPTISGENLAITIFVSSLKNTENLSKQTLKAFQRPPQNTRKVVIATNIAEASVTINGIVYIIDCGFVKLKAYNPSSGIESLVVVLVSQASATQRAGRAGRVRSGKAYRLYTEDAYHDLEKKTCPEMQRSDLAPVVLQLKSLGIQNVLRFTFLSRPPAQCMVRSLELLNALGAIDNNCDLSSPLGIRMAELPVSPMLAKMLLFSGDFECSEEALVITAMLQLENVFITPYNKSKAASLAKLKFSVYEGDHLTLLNVYRAFIRNKKKSKWCHANFLNFRALNHAVKIKEQLQAILKRYKIPIISCEGDDEKIRKCIVAGLFANAAKYHPNGEYRTIRDEHPLHIHPQSVLATETYPPKWVVFSQVLLTAKEYMKYITVIDSAWLLELASHYYEFGTERSIMSKRAKLE
eukprot:gene9820-10828_t